MQKTAHPWIWLPINKTAIYEETDQLVRFLSHKRVFSGPCGFTLARDKAKNGSGRASNLVSLKIWSRGSKHMKFSLVAAVVLMGLSVGASAQSSTYNGGTPHKVKRSPQKPPKSSAVVPAGKSAGNGSASSTNAKNLQGIEHQTAKTSAQRSSGKKAPGSSAIKPVKEKSTPPMNFNGTGAKGTGTTTRAANPYRGRLKQKSSH